MQGEGGLTWGTIGHFSAESRSSSFALEVIFEEVGLWWSCSWRITCSMSIDGGERKKMGKKEVGKEGRRERRRRKRKSNVTVSLKFSSTSTSGHTSETPPDTPPHHNKAYR